MNKEEYKKIITIDRAKKNGSPCIRNLRISVYDILGWLASGMTNKQIIEDYPELTEIDIRAALHYASDKERRVSVVVS